MSIVLNISKIQTKNNNDQIVAGDIKNMSTAVKTLVEESNNGDKEVTNLTATEQVQGASVVATDDFDLKVTTAGLTGHLKLQSSAASTTFTGGATENIAVQVPANAKIVGTQLIVTSLVNVTWDSSYTGGAEQAISTGSSEAEGTTVDKFFDVNTDTDITNDVTDITITPTAGTLDNGAITAIVYYYVFTPIA